MRTSMMGRVAAGLLLSVLAFGTAAQPYPSKPVKVLIPYGPGSGIDVVIRALNESLSKNLGVTFISENRPGAAGTIAAAYVLSQPADGYTLLSDSSSHTIVPSLMAHIPFDTARDFHGVTTLIENPLVLVAARSKGYNSLADLIAAAKAKPGSITYASAGVGTTTHISAEKFRIGAGLDGLHIPFKSSTDGLVEVMAGRIDFTYTALASALSGIQAGRLVPLAMVSRRVAVLPDVPSIDEIVPGASYSTWLGVMVSSKTPRDVVQRLNQEIVKVMQSAEMKERLAKLGAEPWTMTPEEFDALRRKELVDNDRLIKTAGIKTQ
jgi:tripartite-type tricarboxylate transporter receptor subunit TctC